MAPRCAACSSCCAGSSTCSWDLPERTSQEHVLFELLRGVKHVLLGFTGKNPRDKDLRLLRSSLMKAHQSYPDLLQAYVISHPSATSNVQPSCSLVEDQNGAAHERYGARRCCIYLVRPDGYIAWRGTPSELSSLLRHLKRWYRGHTKED